ncbi:MAG: ROK family protein [Anaerolineales bacterium]|nr:ROK family protein [Anaerolineales bacterium]
MAAPQYIGVDIGGTSVRAARFVGQDPVPSRKTKSPTQAAQSAEVILQRLETAMCEAYWRFLPDCAGLAG